MKQSLFESRHQPQWQAFTEQLNGLESGSADAKKSATFAADYRRLCQHLALARERGYSNHLIDELQQLALRGHQQFYRHRSAIGPQLIAFVLAGFPRLVREEWRLVTIASLLFFGSLALMGTLVYLFPDLVYSVMDPSRVSEMESMYDPDTSRLGRFGERDSGDDWMMFGYYIMNNIGIAFQTFASGLLFGIGSLFFLLFNGLMIGAVAGYLTQLGYSETFWSFVIGHGAFELTAIALAGAAGLKLGWALLAPGRLPRGEALRLAATRAVRLLGGAALFLLIAAFIEAYWSSMTFTTPHIKYWVGAGLWALVLAYLCLAGRGGNMRLTDASVAIRPRTPWEAIDLGVLMAGRHRGLLMASWAAVTVPIFALLCALLWQYPTWAILIFWWLKPAYERLPLYILSRALFGDTPTLKQALKAFPGLLKPQLLASLTWRRFSPSRSFDLPVLQLEGLKGKARTQRLNVLSQRDAGAAVWLTVVGVHLETALWIGLGSLVYLMIPTQMSVEWNWQSLINGDTSDWLWLEHLSNLAYVLLLILWEPIYVASGFSLYLNRRTALEGWDIELTFRRLRQRLTGAAYALLLGFGVLLLQVPTPAFAATAHSCPLPAEDPDGPEAARLLAQPLTSEASRESALAILDEPPFENRETVTRWRFGEDTNSEEPSEGTRKALESLFEMFENWTALKSIALFFEALLWALLIGLIGLVLWHYREWLSNFAGRTRLHMPTRNAAPSQLFGLEVVPQSLPDDVASTAERLWQDDPRAALGLLYRALLSRLIHDHKLPLKSAHTEAEVLPLVDGLDDPELSNFSQTLTRHWQNLAYGHRLPPTELRPVLCNDWRRLIEHGGRR